MGLKKQKKYRGMEMSTIKVSQKEAESLLKMLKKTLVSEIEFPSKRETVEFEVVGEQKTDVFTIHIYRGKINRLKYNLGARITKNNTMLLELHIGSSNKHMNPNGEIVVGNHWHIYTEKYGRSWAYPAEDIQNDRFVENTIAFLDRFNVIEKPNIYFQYEII